MIVLVGLLIIVLAVLLVVGSFMIHTGLGLIVVALLGWYVVVALRDYY